MRALKGTFFDECECFVARCIDQCRDMCITVDYKWYSQADGLAEIASAGEEARMVSECFCIKFGYNACVCDGLYQLVGKCCVPVLIFHSWGIGGCILSDLIEVAYDVEAALPDHLYGSGEILFDHIAYIVVEVEVHISRETFGIAVYVDQLAFGRCYEVNRAYAVVER